LLLPAPHHHLTINPGRLPAGLALHQKNSKEGYLGTVPISVASWSAARPTGESLASGSGSQASVD
jgi:hypothetical protein